MERLRAAIDEEVSPVGKEVLRELLNNARGSAGRRAYPYARTRVSPLLFVEVGQDVPVTGGNLRDAVTEGVRKAYREGYLRKVLLRPFHEEEYGRQYAADHPHLRGAGRQSEDRGHAEGRGKRELQRGENAHAPRKERRVWWLSSLEMVKKGGPNPCPPITVGRRCRREF